MGLDEKRSVKIFREHGGLVSSIHKNARLCPWCLYAISVRNIAPERFKKYVDELDREESK